MIFDRATVRPYQQATHPNIMHEPSAGWLHLLCKSTRCADFYLLLCLCMKRHAVRGRGAMGGSAYPAKLGGSDKWEILEIA